MKLNTRYLGLELAHPFMPGASPLVDDMDAVLKLEDAGAAAIVMHSLFEEQILRERYGFAHFTEAGSYASAEASTYFPDNGEFALGPTRYLQQIHQIKQRVSCPVIGSLNGTTPEGWLEYAQLIQQAGADALELNFYRIVTDHMEEGEAVERELLDIVAVVRESVTIPVAVKLSPFYSSLPSIVRKLDALGVAGIICFNRFYQADIDPETLEVVPRLQLSTSSELLLRLRWTAILDGEVHGSLAISGGVHEPIDAVKSVMAGADAVQIVSALLHNGPEYLGYIRRKFEEWGDEHGYVSVEEMRGCMSLRNCPEPTAFERGNYLKTLQSWHLNPLPAGSRRKA